MLARLLRARLETLIPASYGRLAHQTLAAALAAEEGGAGRVEVCAALQVGGLTPPDSLIGECVHRLALPVFVLVRARAGAFSLAPPERAHLVNEVRRVAALGAAGIVAGALTEVGAVDTHTMEAILAAADPLPVTFHRAFDQVRDQVAALEELIGLGVRRVLTSGGGPTAAEGAARIGALVRQAAGRIGILAGGSVRAHNPVIAEAVEAGHWDRLIDYVNREVFDKPEDFYTLEKLRKATGVDRRITLREIRFKSSDELLEEEFAKFVADRKPDEATQIPAIKVYFKAYASSTRTREIIDSRHYQDLATNPFFNSRDFKAGPARYRQLVPEYIKDYLPLNQFLP